MVSKVYTGMLKPLIFDQMNKNIALLKISGETLDMINLHVHTLLVLRYLIVDVPPVLIQQQLMVPE